MLLCCCCPCIFLSCAVVILGRVVGIASSDALYTLIAASDPSSFFIVCLSSDVCAEVVCENVDTMHCFFSVAVGEGVAGEDSQER